MPQLSAKRARPAPLDAATIRACSDVLRGHASQRRWSANALVARIPAQIGADAIARIVDAALLELTERRREIVTRCEMDGESYADVAVALHVSERHLFRERRAALSHIARALLNAEKPRRQPVTVAPDAVDARVATSAVLEQSGRWQVAADMLERVAPELSTDRRVPVELRLSRLYRNADRFALAMHHAQAARALTTEPWQCAEADVGVASIATCSGDWRRADALIERSLETLRTAATPDSDGRIQNAFVEALGIQIELAGSRGVDAAVAPAEEAARAIAGSTAVDVRVVIGVRSVAAMSDILRARRLAHSEAVLWDCYHRALACGFTRDSLIVAMQLSAYYRLSGRPGDALALLAPLVGAAGVAGTGWVRGAMLNELVYASLATGAIGPAGAYLDAFAGFAMGNALTQASAELARARVLLARREFAAALRFATAAEAAYAGIGQPRLMGTSLRMQAEALNALGERERALRAITAAVDLIKETSHPQRLATAYRVMARISGRQQYAIAARKLLRSIHPPR
jgi:tetratricopeptide (TPR) repeat protein/predicted DCC family thiol-disulfide oxidoreductase YuxK